MYVVVHWCTLSLCYLGAERWMIITEIQIQIHQVGDYYIESTLTYQARCEHSLLLLSACWTWCTNRILVLPSRSQLFFCRVQQTFESDLSFCCSWQIIFVMLKRCMWFLNANDFEFDLFEMTTGTIPAGQTLSTRLFLPPAQTTRKPTETSNVRGISFQSILWYCLCICICIDEIWYRCLLQSILGDLPPFLLLLLQQPLHPPPPAPSSILFHFIRLLDSRQ